MGKKRTGAAFCLSNLTILCFCLFYINVSWLTFGFVLYRIPALNLVEKSVKPMSHLELQNESWSLFRLNNCNTVARKKNDIGQTIKCSYCMGKFKEMLCLFLGKRTQAEMDVTCLCVLGFIKMLVHHRSLYIHIQPWTIATVHVQCLTVQIPLAKQDRVYLDHYAFWSSWCLWKDFMQSRVN